jgi:phospholipase C
VRDPPHDHRAWLQRNGPKGAVRSQYTQNDITAYWAYAKKYTLCDRYFTEVASQSEPNHLMLIAADSPIIDNASLTRKYQAQPPYDLPSLPVALAAAGLDWRNYADKNASYFRHIAALASDRSNVPSGQFDSDVGKGYLPAVCWLYAPDGKSEHPPWKPGSGPVVKPGMQWTVNRVSKVGNSPMWSSTVIFITWDDWGGWYDHVDPPNDASWQGDGPAGYKVSQFRYGPRVPCLVVSPYAKPGYISKVQHSHVSLLKFCCAQFGLQPWNNRLKRADDMSDCFDFSRLPAAVPSTFPGGVTIQKPVGDSRRSKGPGPSRSGSHASGAGRARPPRPARSSRRHKK